jgi:hypothetical protein
MALGASSSCENPSSQSHLPLCQEQALECPRLLKKSSAPHRPSSAPLLVIVHEPHPPTPALDIHNEFPNRHDQCIPNHVHGSSDISTLKQSICYHFMIKNNNAEKTHKERTEKNTQSRMGPNSTCVVHHGYECRKGGLPHWRNQSSHSPHQSIFDAILSMLPDWYHPRYSLKADS